MFDRFVRQIRPAIEGDDKRRSFSSHLESPNLILLGDPGAGKSHLFEQAAELSGGSFLTARNFLNAPSHLLAPALFIDALDEKRAGRGDNNTIDRMVEKLFERVPTQVRISCRAQDWLGDTDMAAFQHYFDHHGGAIVLALEPLSRQEMVLILTDRGIADPTGFLEQAYERELDDFLLNPQNLLMLAEVVRAGDWPKSRRELYQAATKLLLNEHSPTRSRTGEGVYTAEELRDAAGAICALRLIADVEGISLRENEKRAGFPSYRSIDFPDVDKIQATLGRRTFKATGAEETVDYSHRTTAEFLAAAWLAKKVRGGFPIGRIRALIGVDGYPASELRGLHAWLPVFLPEHANLLIEADPFGILTYGDAGSLEPSGRRYLLRALARLADMDPWFRSDNWSTRGLGALAGPDMVDFFRAILRAKSANFMLRSIVFDALANGVPLPELQPDLGRVLADESLPYSERVDAALALIKLGELGRKEVVRHYTNLGRSENDIRLRTKIVTALYGEKFHPADVATLLVDALNCEGELSTGSLWVLPDGLPASEIADVLDRLDPEAARTRANKAWRNTSDVLYTFDRILLRALKEAPGSATAERLTSWLHFRHAMVWHDAIGRTDEIKQELVNRSAELHTITQHHLAALEINEKRHRHVHELDEITLGVIDRDDLLDWYCEYLTEAGSETAKEEFIYEMALWSSYRATPRAKDKFDWLWILADQHPNLAAVRDRNLAVPIPDWQSERYEGHAQRIAEKQAARAKNRREFEEHQAEIRSAERLDWLDWLAGIYLGLFSDVDQKKTPRERLVAELGGENADAAMEGFRALLHRNDLPRFDQHIQLHAEGKHYTVAYPIQAAFDEEWAAVTGLSSFDDDLLKSALAVDLFCLVPYYTNDRNNKRGWKVWLFAHRAELVHDVCLAIARSDLLRGTQFPDGLSVLLSDEAVAAFRKAAILRLLAEFPTASAHTLQALLKGALECTEAQPDFLVIAEKVLDGNSGLSREQEVGWLAAAYLISPTQYAQRVAAAAGESAEIAWQIRDFLGFRTYDDRATPIPLSLDQVSEIIRTFAQHYPNSYPPRGSSSGSRNPWQAAEFVRSLIDRIASQPTEQSGHLLAKLLSDDNLNSYREHIRHALAGHGTRRRDAEYVQPDWEQTIGALFRSIPANVADLHALVFDQLQAIRGRITSSNTDLYKRFWNEDSYGRIETPKPEESGRDVLVDMLRDGLRPLGVIVEPEGHMVADKRVDIWASLPGRKVLIELKRDYNPDLWNAAEGQLDRFYTRDPEASGFGIYGVFWFGPKRGDNVPAPPDGRARPETPEQMEEMLRAILPSEKRAKIAVIVVDVSEPIA